MWVSAHHFADWVQLTASRLLAIGLRYRDCDDEGLVEVADKAGDGKIAKFRDSIRSALIGHGNQAAPLGVHSHLFPLDPSRASIALLRL